MDPNLVSSVKDIYTLIGLVIVSVVYLITLFYKLKTSKKQSKELTDTFTIQTKELVTRVEMQNEKIVKRLEELHDIKNNMDLQAAMDVIQIINIKSMLRIMDGIKIIMEENDVEDDNRRPIIFEKVRNVIEIQTQEDLLILSRIYYKGVQLSHYTNGTDKGEIINTISKKINLMKDKRQFTDVMDYIRNKYSHTIQSIQIQLGSK
jgi:hypothetical protein